ncbi:MAG: response regulator [Thalassolituus sp.]|jgi:response regulator RpfG family c-di-GMP phosphodiesterase|uniref:HD domain-containing phosphohydrolase n=1 Tax=Thalassolituus sp. TaxID=2030822 RepID=UPI0027D6ED93|nr:HD domain-containing phosphohydrolase [Thalassolituus sp.]MDQ4424695.1 response regulator [Thalassolituus sp.]MDQ4426803.1 response regulator [Thalassolituus sp.]
MAFADAAALDNEKPVKPVILLVDDEENILKSLTRSLGRLDVDITTASSVSDALYILENTDVDLVISDMRMPVADGAELLKTVAEKSPDTLRFLLTGHSDMESTIRAINEGQIHQYLTKPWDDNKLRALIEESLHTRLLEARNQRLQAELVSKNHELEELNSSLEKRVTERTEELRLNARLLEHAFDDLQKSYGHVLRLASSLGALREPGAAAAAELRSSMAESLAEALGFADSDVREIRDAALLADLGNIGLPDELLNKPLVDFDGADMQQYAQVPVLAEAALMGIPGMRHSAAMLRSQFERFDGSGYPDHLSGSSIPAGARIISIVRDYTDLIRGRFTGEEIKPQLAKAELVRQSNMRYDPAILNIFCEDCGAFDTANLADDACYLGTDELEAGMVLAQDLYSEKGMILLRKGHVLTSELINRLSHLQNWSGRTLDVAVEKQTDSTKEIGG